MWVATEIFKKWFHKKEEEEEQDEEDQIDKLKKGNNIFVSMILYLSCDNPLTVGIKYEKIFDLIQVTEN